MKTNCDRLLILFFLPKTGFKTLHLQRAIFMSDLRPYLEIWRLKRIFNLTFKMGKVWRHEVENEHKNRPLQTQKRMYLR